MRLLSICTLALHWVAETLSIPALRVGNKKTLTYWVRVLCGAAGSRTPVQARRPYTFYMLIPALLSGFVRCRTTKHILSSCLFRRQIGTLIRLAPYCVRPLVGLDQGITARETSRPDTCAWKFPPEREVLKLLLFAYAARA